MSEIETSDHSSESSSRAFFGRQAFLGKLVNGDFSLARTYWLYGIFVGVIYELITLLGAIAFVAILVPEGDIEAILAAGDDIEAILAAGDIEVQLLIGFGFVVGLVYISYQFVWLVGLYRAAVKYEGPKIWTVLAAMVSLLSICKVVRDLFSTVQNIGSYLGF